MDAWIQILSGLQPARVIVYSNKLSVSWCLHFRQIEEVVKGISFYLFQGITLRDFTRGEREKKKKKKKHEINDCFCMIISCMHDPTMGGGGCVLWKKNRDALSCPHIITCSYLPLEARMGTYNPDAVEMQVSVFPVDVTILLIYLWTQSYRLLEVDMSSGEI